MNGKEVQPVRDLLDYPLGAVRSAFKSVVGWTAVVAITGLVGLFVGLCFSEGRLYPPLDVPGMVGLLFLSAIVRLEVFIAFMGAAGAWSLGLVLETLKSRVIIAIANFALWVAVGAWMCSFY